MRMRQIVICGLTRSTTFFFFKLYYKCHDFRKNVIEQNLCLIFCTAFVWNVFHCKNKLVRCDTKCMSVSKWSVLHCCHILMNLEFSRRIFEKIVKYQISWKSVKWEQSCCVGADRHTDRQTDMTQLTVDFRNFANTPNKREEQRTRAVSGHTDGRCVELKERNYAMKLLTSRTELQPRQNGGSNRFLSSPKRLNRVLGPPSPHSVVIRGSFFLWRKRRRNVNLTT